MNIQVRDHQEQDIPTMAEIWNQVVEDGIAFPQEELLDEKSGREFFESQSLCGVAEDTDSGHICNASYGVSSESRGLHIGEKLVRHSMELGRELMKLFVLII